MSFKNKGFEIVKNAIHPQLLNQLKIEFEIIRDLHFLRYKTDNPYAFGDSQSPKSFSMYNAICFESLCLLLNSKISKVTGKDLVPSYSYSRIYYKGAILEPHKDRPSCEYSATICIDTTNLWDFYIRDKQDNINKLKLNPGDMCVYSGVDLEHWREPYGGEKQIQCFLHYVDMQGPFKDFKYDKRIMLGLDKIQKTKKHITYS